MITWALYAMLFALLLGVAGAALERAAVATRRSTGLVWPV